MAVVKFGDIVRDIKINVDRTNNSYEHYVAGDHMDSEDLTIHRCGNFATDDVGPAFTRIFKPGQILYGSRRTYLKKVAVADFEGICANTTFVLESKDESLFDNRILPFIMLSDAFTRWSIAHSKGSTNPYVLFSDLADYEFDLPPIAEQKVLADKLWAAYRLKESYKKLIAATEEMVKSQFIEMFFKNTWKEKYLEDVVSEDCSLSYGIVQPGEGVEDGIPVVRPVDLVSDIVEPDCLKKTTVDIANSYKRTTLKGGELLLCVRGTTGLLSMASNRLNGGNVTRGIVPIWFKKDISKAFMFHQMKSDYVQTQIKENTYGTTLLQINIKDLRKIKVILPPEDLQLKFVSVAEQADKSGFELRKSIVSIDKVIKSLINEKI